MTKTDHNPILIAKKAAGYAAVDMIEDGMLIGLGTGSTTSFFIEALGKKCQEGLKITAVATSNQSAHQAQLLNIPLEDPENITKLDIVVDGADEIDHHKNMIKGGGGALLREKLLAQACREMVVVVDETKLVDHLGTFPLPVEIARFVYRSTLHRLEMEGYKGTLRLTRDQKPFLTDNGNYIVDIQYKGSIDNPFEEQIKLKNIAGVIETGLFYHIAGRVIIGYMDGCFKVRS